MRLAPRLAAIVLPSALLAPGLRPVAGSPPPAPSAAALSAEQALARRQLADLHAAPGGERLAFTVTEPPSGERPSRHVWVLDLKTRAARQFTSSPKSEWHARWSPAGGWLAFLSNRGEHTELWRLATDGGEAVRVADLKADVAGFEWAPDGKRLAVLAPEPKPEAEEKREKDKDDARLVDLDERPPCLWLVEAESGKARQLTAPPWRVSEVHWAPGGDRLFAVATDRPEVNRWTERIFALDAATGRMEAIAAPGGPIGSFLVSPDGRSLAYAGARLDGPVPHDLYFQPSGGGAARNLTAAGIDRMIERFEFRDGSHLVALAAAGFGSRLYTLDTLKPAAAGPAGIEAGPELPAVADFTLLPGGGLAVVAERITEPAEVWLAGKPGDQEAAWRAAGIDGFIFAGCDAIEANAALLRALGGLPSPLAGEGVIAKQ